MKKSNLLFALLLFIVQNSMAQNIQWASKVINFSSQYGETIYSAKQVLGKPNVLPDFKDSPCAWSPKGQNTVSDEYITVGFSTPAFIKQVAVAESYNPGSVKEIFLLDEKGKEYKVYENKNPGPLTEKGRMLCVTMPETQYKVSGAKVYLDTYKVEGWNHIDAIGISDSETPITAKINFLPDLVFPSLPENLGTGVNSQYDEIMPVISPDGRTIYFDRKDHPENTDGKINDDIWYSTLSGSVWSKAVNIGPPLNNAGHNFLSSISPDGNKALLGNEYQPDGTMLSGLSITERSSAGWGFPKKLPVKDYYNKSKYSEFFMGADCKTILFTIERDDTYGGKDLYVSFLQGSEWTAPMNLGSNVNTAGTEMSPFLAADGKTIYFSSNGYSGYGNKDMFMSKRLDETWKSWSEPINLGPKINSEAWDAYYTIPAKGDYAYFSREKDAIGKTDLFRILLPNEMRPEPVTVISGKVLHDYFKSPLQAKIVVENAEDGKEVATALSSPETGEFILMLPLGKKYIYYAVSESTFSMRYEIDVPANSQYKETHQDLMLAAVSKGTNFILTNVKTDKSDTEILPESYPELDRLMTFLKNNPSITIEIGGHTSNFCQEALCLKLSEAKAKSVYDYLVKQSITSSRLTFKGYGSQKPIVSNTNEVEMAKNQRIEITITGN